MTLLLECREKIKQFYRLNSVVILPVLKFLIAFFALNGVNTMMGYMPRLDNVAIVMIASLACSFLPAGCLTLLCALFSLAHMYSLSMEVAALGICVYLLLFLMLFRFGPGDSYVVILTPLMFALKIPYVVPVAVGLICGPISAVSVACGVIVYYVLNTIVGSAAAIRAMGNDAILDRARFLIETLAGNKSMLVVAAAFAITVVVVYVIRRMSVEHAWTIAMIAGVMVNLVILLVGDLLYDINFSLGGAILGSIVTIAIAKVIEFFRFFVDYSRTERVQFEDDEYYYYVKAVPKMNVTAATKTVKHINKTAAAPGASAGTEYAASSRTQVQSRRPASQSRVTEVSEQRTRGGDARTRAQGQAASGRASAPRQTSVRQTGSTQMTSGGSSYGGGRSVTTERTARPGDTAQRRTGGTRGVTVGSNQISDDTDDYEELF